MPEDSESESDPELDPEPEELEELEEEEEERALRGFLAPPAPASRSLTPGSGRAHSSGGALGMECSRVCLGSAAVAGSLMALGSYLGAQAGGSSQ